MSQCTRFASYLTELIKVGNLLGVSDPKMESVIKKFVIGDINPKSSISEKLGKSSNAHEPTSEPTEVDGGGRREESRSSAWSVNRIREFVRVYRAVAFAHQKFLRSLSKERVADFAPFILPPLVDDVFWRSSNLRGAIEEAARKRRKARTDALFPYFGHIRTIVEFRTNQIKRIREVFHQLVKKADAGELRVPYRFSVQESASSFAQAIEYQFILWSREGVKFYKDNVDLTAKSSSKTKNTGSYFLEYIGCVDCNGKRSTEDMWFTDIIKFNACHKPTLHDSSTNDFMRSYGLSKTDYERLSSLVVHGRELSSALYDLVREVRKVTANFRPVFFHPDGIYTICLFGRVAVRLACVTGCRVNEMQQISAESSCLAKVNLPNLKRPVYAVTAIPKLSRETVPFYIDERCVKFISEVTAWIAAQSSLGRVPRVKGARNLAKHKRKELRPYMFQLNNRAMDRSMIVAMMRFMLHGLHFKTRDGKLFQPGLHDLRHLTATALRGMGVPLDVIARMLKQRNLDVTNYYSEPTTVQVVTAMQGLRMAAIGIGSPEGVRAPEELMRILQEADGRVGALTNVVGGMCSVSADCAAKFACVGCAGLVPDHKEIRKIERIRWRQLEDMNYYSAEGNLAEVRKAEAVIRDCDRVIEEMRLQEEADDDASRKPFMKGSI